MNKGKALKDLQGGREFLLKFYFKISKEEKLNLVKETVELMRKLRDNEDLPSRGKSLNLMRRGSKVLYLRIKKDARKALEVIYILLSFF